MANIKSKTAQHTASDIANWFLQRNEVERKLRGAEYMSHLKLQKLLYYAQGGYLALHGKKLFKEDLLAWAHGPVVEEVYHKYKRYGSRSIIKFYPPVETYKPQEEETLEMVFDVFGKYSASGLRNMTHNERPWKETRVNDVISTDLICDFFLEEYVEDEPETSQKR